MFYFDPKAGWSIACSTCLTTPPLDKLDELRASSRAGVVAILESVWWEIGENSLCWCTPCSRKRREVKPFSVRGAARRYR